MNYQNFPEVISKTLSTLINSLLTSMDSNVFSVLDKIVFLKSSYLFDTYFISFFTKKFSLVTLSEILVFGFLLYYGAAYLISFFTSNSFQKPLSFLTRLFFSALLVRYSMELCEKIIDFFELITETVKTLGISMFSFHLSFSVLYERLSNVFLSDLNNPFGLFSFDGILKTFLSFCFVNLLFTYAVRFIYIKLLILISPLICLTLCLDQTIWIFKIWLKNFISLLFVQIVICIILLIIFSLNNVSDPLISKLLYVGSIICLIRATSFVREFSSGFTSDVTSSFASIKNLFS